MVDNGAGESNNQIIGNDVSASSSGGIYGFSPANGDIIAHNKGFVTENSGTATFSASGTETQFTIPHNCALTPTHVSVEAMSEDAVGDKYISVDANNIVVTYITAPPAGTNNIVLNWKAEV